MSSAKKQLKKDHAFEFAAPQFHDFTSNVDTDPNADVWFGNEEISPLVEVLTIPPPSPRKQTTAVPQMPPRTFTPSSSSSSRARRRRARRRTCPRDSFFSSKSYADPSVSAPS